MIWLAQNLKWIIGGFAGIIMLAIAFFTAGATWQSQKDEIRILQAHSRVDTVFHFDTIRPPGIKARNVKPWKPATSAVNVDSILALKNLDALQTEFTRVTEPVIVDTVINGIGLFLEYQPFLRMFPMIDVQPPDTVVRTRVVTIETQIEVDIPWYEYAEYVAGGAALATIYFLAKGQ